MSPGMKCDNPEFENQKSDVTQSKGLKRPIQIGKGVQISAESKRNRLLHFCFYHFLSLNEKKKFQWKHNQRGEKNSVKFSRAFHALTLFSRWLRGDCIFYFVLQIISPVVCTLQIPPLALFILVHSILYSVWV